MPRLYFLGLLVLLLPPARTALAQRPTLVGTSPLPNALAVSRNSAVTASFSQPLTGGAAALQVFGSQRLGRRTALAPATLAGSTLTYSPGTTAYPPGELVSYTVTTAATSSGGTPAQPWVGQFRTATGGTGEGAFVAAQPQNTSSAMRQPTAADVDNDGDLDLVGISSVNELLVRFNDGTGVFGSGQTTALSGTASTLRLGDVDGDGDLDALVSIYSMPQPNGAPALIGNTVEVRLNNGSGTFGSNQPFTVNARPNLLELGDFDGDGDLDVVVNCSGQTTQSAAVNVRFNDGQGTFSGTQSLLTGQPASGLAVGDVDNDGDLDLTTTEASQGTLGTLRNDGTGQFGTRQASSISSSAVSLRLADLDGDRDLDALLVVDAGAAMAVQLNNGSGTFGGSYSLTLPRAGLYSLEVGDVDADGDLDFVSYGSQYNDPVVTCLNSGAGTFLVAEQFVNYGSLGTLGLGDFDGDGDLDLLLPTAGLTPFFTTYFNQPRTPLLRRFVPASGAAGTAVQAYGRALGRATSFTVNGVASTFTTPNDTTLTFTVPAGCSATPAIAVTTGAGRSTISTDFRALLLLQGSTPAANALAAPRTSSAVTLRTTEALAASATQPTTTTGLKVHSTQAGGAKAGTLTRTAAGLAYVSSLPSPQANFMPGEVVQVSAPASVVGTGGLPLQPRVFSFTAAVGGTGTGKFLPGSDPATGSGPDAVAAADIDGDGDVDLLTANQYANSVSVLRNDGTGTFTLSGSTAVGTRPYALAVGDVDNDGDLDVLAANNGTNTVSVRLNNGGGTFTNAPNVTIQYAPAGIALGDADADGDLDLFICDYNDRAVYIRLNNGSGVFSGGQALNDFFLPYSVAVGDVDGDGDLDFVATNGSNNSTLNTTVGVAYNDGTGVYGNTQTIGTSAGPVHLALADMDGDGDLDLLAAAVSGYVSVRLNNGQGSFGTGPNVVVGFNPYSVAAADVDGDGDLDLVAANYGGNVASNVSVRLNNGQGSFSNGPDAGAGLHLMGLVMADFDGDGDVDLATANNNVTGTVSVRLNNPRPLAAIPGQAAPALALYPNPARLATQVTGLPAYAAVTLYDAVGRLVLTATANASGTAELQLSAACPPGVYLVRSGPHTGRLLVE